MSEEKSTGAITGITTFLLLAFILPGIVYVFTIMMLFDTASLKGVLPTVDLSTDVIIGAVIFLGLSITSIVFVGEIATRWLMNRIVKRDGIGTPDFTSFAEMIFKADRSKELGWYFWQLWGQRIMHLNIGWGVFIIYWSYKWISHQMYPFLWFQSWKDWTWVIIIANVICASWFARWHNALMSTLSDVQAPKSL